MIQRQLSEKIHDILELLKTHPKVLAVILFGSQAKGIATPISDIDIAVVMKDPSPSDEAEIGSLYSKDIDLVLFHRLPLYIQHEVLRFGKELFVKNPEEFLEIKLKVLRNYLETKWLYDKITGVSTK